MKDIYTHRRLKHSQERIASGLSRVWVKGKGKRAPPHSSYSQVQIQRRKHLQQCARSVQKVPSHVIWNIETFIEQETLYIGQWRFSPLKNKHLGTSHISPNCHQLPRRIFLNLINGLTPNLGCRGAESPRWFDVLPKNYARDVMHEKAHCHGEAANHQLPKAVAFWIIQ